MQKEIWHILEGRDKNITENEVVKQSLPHKDFRFANPFIVVHHMPPAVIAPGAVEERLHPHPHRGFAPVTFMWQGQGYHMDNAGNSMTVSAGDVQWMFAGKGILHSEGPSAEFLRNGGTYELVQLWWNVPAANKGDKPFYQYIKSGDMPAVAGQEGVDLKLVSGEYDNHTGPLQNFTPIVSIWGTVAAGKKVTLTATPGYWTMLYIVSGSLVISGQAIAPYHLVVFEQAKDEVTFTAKEDTRIIFLSAEPIDEPLAVKDNYVMNTPAEIEQAIDDYKNGRFGTLER